MFRSDLFATPVLCPSWIFSAHFHILSSFSTSLLFCFCLASFKLTAFNTCVISCRLKVLFYFFLQVYFIVVPYSFYLVSLPSDFSVNFTPMFPTYLTKLRQIMPSWLLVGRHRVGLLASFNICSRKVFRGTFIPIFSSFDGRRFPIVLSEETFTKPGWYKEQDKAVDGLSEMSRWL